MVLLTDFYHNVLFCEPCVSSIFNLLLLYIFLVTCGCGQAASRSLMPVVSFDGTFFAGSKSRSTRKKEKESKQRRLFCISTELFRETSEKRRNCTHMKSQLPVPHDRLVYPRLYGDYERVSSFTFCSGRPILYPVEFADTIAQSLRRS